MGKLNPNSALQLDNQLCFALYSTSLSMTKLYTPWLSALQLTYPQYLILLVLWEQDNMTVTELGDRLYLNSGTLTPLLKRMEASGWLLRQRSDQDQRRVHIQLTPQGVALKAQAADIPRCVVEATGCTLTELLSITQQLKTLRERLHSF